MDSGSKEFVELLRDGTSATLVGASSGGAVFVMPGLSTDNVIHEWPDAVNSTLTNSSSPADSTLDVAVE